MALTLGTTGMDSATEAELHTAFKVANAETGGHWQLLGENDADYVVVDMDSMYGPMSWLRLHAAGKHVIGLTSAPRTQTDYRLTRPFSSEGLVALLAEIAAANGLAPVAAAAPPAAVTAPPVQAPEAHPQTFASPAVEAPAVTAPAVEAHAVEAPPVEHSLPAGMSPAPMPQDLLPEEHPQPVDEEAQPPSPAPGLPASAEAGTLAPTTIEPARPAASVVPEPEAEPERQPEPEPALPPRPRGLADWLVPGQLSGRMRYRRNAGPTLLIDPVTRQFHGPAALKPLAGYFDGEVAESDFEPADAGTWSREAAALGPAQPLARLQWFAGLLAGRGSLLPGYDASGMFKLGKWPQTEREFPKHFRIATAMMKGPATLEEITAASGVPRDEVIDFINASLATGFAEPYREPEPEPEPQKPTGLFGRLRGK